MNNSVQARIYGKVAARFRNRRLFGVYPNFYFAVSTRQLKNLPL